MQGRASLAWIAASLLGACSGEGAKDDSGRGGRVPAYGPTRQLQGIWTSAFETSAFTRCRSRNLEACHEGPDCWLEMTEGFARQLQQALPQGDDREGVFYLRFTGQQANNGPFGHLGAYPCQVTAIGLISAEIGLP